MSIFLVFSNSVKHFHTNCTVLYFMLLFIYIFIHHNGSKWEKKEKQTEQKLN